MIGIYLVYEYSWRKRLLVPKYRRKLPSHCLVSVYRCGKKCEGPENICPMLRLEPRKLKPLALLEKHANSCGFMRFPFLYCMVHGRKKAFSFIQLLLVRDVFSQFYFFFDLSQNKQRIAPHCTLHHTFRKHLVLHHVAPFAHFSRTFIVLYLIPYYTVWWTESCLLCVSVPPLWTTAPENKSVIVGDDVVYPCSAEGYPTPQITWKFRSC